MTEGKVREAVSKKEIADILKVDQKTLANYCNNRYFPELSSLGYQINQKKFTPAQVNWLKEKLGF